MGLFNPAQLSVYLSEATEYLPQQNLAGAVQPDYEPRMVKYETIDTRE